MDELGRIIDPGLRPAPDRSLLEKAYRLMTFCRMADAKALKLQRQGRMGTYGSNLGHEGCQVGAGMALTKDDWFFPYFRDLGVFLAMGLPLKHHYLYWMGHESGMDIPPGLNIFPVSIPVASQLPQAVGAGLAVRNRRTGQAVLCSFGDGATSEGDFHEALNFAGVFGTPNVFLCVNNQYAISMPRARQTASATLAQKALAYGFSGLQVDGNDVLAVYEAVKEARERARSGGGPTLIEALTYRLSDHTTSDDASRYRSREEVEEWGKKDPVARLRLYLKSQSWWDPVFEDRVVSESEAAVEKAVEEAEQTPPPSLDDIFRFTYADMPPRLREQLEEFRTAREEKPR